MGSRVSPKSSWAKERDRRLNDAYKKDARPWVSSSPIPAGYQGKAFARAKSRKPHTCLTRADHRRNPHADCGRILYLQNHDLSNYKRIWQYKLTIHNLSLLLANTNLVLRKESN
jgi:hypothetical protein